MGTKEEINANALRKHYEEKYMQNSSLNMSIL